MPRRNFRPWPTTIVATSIAAAVLVIAVWALLDRGNATGYGILAGLAVIGLRRSTRLGVSVDESGLRVLRFGPATVMPWTEIEDIDCDLIAMHGLFGFYAPILFAGGEPVTLAALGSYRREIVEQRTRDLRVAAACVPLARTAPVR